MMAHNGHAAGEVSLATSNDIALPETDLATHAGEQIFGISRYVDDDSDRLKNDLDSMHTFSASPPSYETIHPDWVGKFSALMCSKHLGGLSGDGTRALRPANSNAFADHLAIAT